jgi:4-carboxymuconolactone decarboxylase
MRASSDTGAERALDRRAMRALVRFAAAMTAGEPRAAARALRDARRAGAARRAAEEVVLMLVLHAGYPAALEAGRVLSETWPGRARRSREGGPASWMRRGEALCRAVYGPVYARLLAGVRRAHPDLARWMIEQGYGRVLSRPGLDPAARELVAVAVLAVGGWERQLTSHLRGAQRLGAPRPAIRGAWETGRRAAPRRARAAATRAWRAGAGSAPRRGPRAG